MRLDGYLFLVFFTGIGVGAAMIGVVRRRKSIPWVQMPVIALAVIISWGLTLVRGSNYLVGDIYFIPDARYAFPVIIPTILILCFGWLEFYRWLEFLLGRVGIKLPGIQKIPWQSVAAALYFIFFIFLDAIALATIIRFYGM